MPRLLALDLDGTLVRRDGQVDERDRDAIFWVQERGLCVTIVTGRLFAGTRTFAEQLRIRCPVACADGAQLVDPRDGRELEHRGIVGRAAELLRRTLASRAAATFLLYDRGVIFDSRGAPFTRYVRSWTPTLEEVAGIYDHACWSSPRGISGVVVVGMAAAIKATAAELRQASLLEILDFEITRSPTGQVVPRLGAMLVHARGVSKGSALERLAEHCGCTTDDVVVVGDWLNDVAMFRAARRSFVMAHAPASVRREATDVLTADGSSGGGVAEAVARLWPAERGSSW